MGKANLPKPLSSLQHYFYLVYSFGGLLWQRGTEVRFDLIASTCNRLLPKDEPLTFAHVRQMVTVDKDLITLEPLSLNKPTKSPQPFTTTIDELTTLAPSESTEMENQPVSSLYVICFPHRARRPTPQRMLKSSSAKFEKALKRFATAYQDNPDTKEILVPEVELIEPASASESGSISYGRLANDQTIFMEEDSTGGASKQNGGENSSQVYKHPPSRAVETHSKTGTNEVSGSVRKETSLAPRGMSKGERVLSFVDQIQLQENFFSDQIRHIQIIPPRPAICTPIACPLLDVASTHISQPNSSPSERGSIALLPAVFKRLQSKGISSLYVHQAQTIQHIRKGHHVVVATSTSSGKSMAYNIPVWERILENRDTRALYVFPTKALAQDQVRAVRDLIDDPNVYCDTYDGDTPVAHRRHVAQNAQIVLSNPDMLHVTMLPNHNSMDVFFKNLKFIVIDEAHVYRGVFGSHVAVILRRLRRVCSLYNSNPVFICCSATISNPKQLTEALIGDKTFLVRFELLQKTPPASKHIFEYYFILELKQLYSKLKGIHT